MPMTEQLEQLHMTHRETIPYDYIDPYGRMIVRHYFATWEKASHRFMQHLGTNVHASLELTGPLDASMLGHGITLAD